MHRCKKRFYDVFYKSLKNMFFMFFFNFFRASVLFNVMFLLLS